MTVARMRKKVFQPRVTAKPRHTIIRDKPQPDGKIYIYNYYIDYENKRQNKQRVDTEKDKVDDFSTRFMQTMIKKF